MQRETNDSKRSSDEAKCALFADVDLALLGLLDKAVRKAVVMADSLSDDGPCVLDASAAHRIASGWAYGFPGMVAGQITAIADARHVTNPGCYLTGSIALRRLLVEANLIPVEYPISINAMSGCSGVKKSMVEAY